MLGISEQAVSKALTRTKIPSTWVFKIASIYGVSPDWLRYGRGPMRQGEEVACPPSGQAVLEARIAALEAEKAALQQELKESQGEALKAYKLLVQKMEPPTDMVQFPPEPAPASPPVQPPADQSRHQKK